MNNSTSSNRGCLLAALIVAGVLLVGGIVAATALFQFKAKRSEMYNLETQMVDQAQEAAMRFDSDQRSGGPVVVVEQSSIGDYSPTELGESLEAKHYVAIASASNLTSLAKQKFIGAAEKMPVDWLVRVEDIKEDLANDGQISGQFSMPYEIRESHSSFGSAISISATFPAEKGDELIFFRSGDFVRIRGRLNIPNNNTNSVRLLDPEIAMADKRESDHK